VADTGLWEGHGRVKVQKVPKLAKHRVKQRKTTAIGGEGNPPFSLPLDPPLMILSTQLKIKTIDSHL